MQSTLKAAARRLSKGHPFTCASGTASPLSLSRLPPSLAESEAPQGPLVLLARHIASTARLPSDPSWNSQESGGGPPIDGQLEVSSTGTSRDCAGRRDNSAAAPRLAKGHLSFRASASSGPVPLSGLSPLPVPEAHAGLLLGPLGGAPGPRSISTTATLSSNSNSNSKPRVPGPANDPATGSAPVPRFRLTSFGGPPGSKLTDSDEFCQRKEVLQSLPVNRLIIMPVPGQTHLFPDLGRELFRSALLIPFVSYLRKCTSEGVFKEDNIGVLEELNAFGLKEQFPYEVDNLTDDQLRKNFQEARDYAVARFEKIYGKGILDQFPALKALNQLIDDDTLPLDPLKIVNNVALLSNENTAVLNQRMHDLLIKVIPLQIPSEQTKADKVLLCVPYTAQTVPHTSSDDFWLSIARSNPWLKNWIDYADKPLPDDESSSVGLLKHHRHGCTAHWMEGYVQDVISRLPITSMRTFNLAVQPITRSEILDLYFYSYPKFTCKTYDPCVRQGLDGYLDIHGLFPIPTWYS